MNIELRVITVKELTDGFRDNDDDGVFGYGGRLDIRPPYQRAFIYGDKDRNAVINTVTKGYPLNVMYWVVREDGSFEVMDGQQRTISLCQYVTGDFSFNNLYFHNLTNDKQQQILDYELSIYFCSGTDSEKLEWFKTINIAGLKLTAQELRNAVYSGPWTANAKTYFSRRNVAAHGLGGDYVNTGGDHAVDRQGLLGTGIKWISQDNIDEYMSVHQHDENASELWHYFQRLINWVKATFPKYRKEMKGIDWGHLYNQFKDETFDTDKLEKQVTEMMTDEDVTNKSGIYRYVLTGEETSLNIRKFSDNQKREAYERQEGICVRCNKHFELNEMEADHITPWRLGGKTLADNCQMLCQHDNRIKSGK